MPEEGYKVKYVILDEFFAPLIEFIIKNFILQKDSNRPTCLAIIARTNTGKTEFTKNIIERIPELYSAYSLSRDSILAIELTTFIKLHNLYRFLLKKLNWSFPESLKDPAELEELLVKAIRIKNVKLIVIDEYNQLEKRGLQSSIKLQLIASLRNISTKTKRPILITGTEGITTLFSEDPETSVRFIKIDFPRLRLVRKYIPKNYYELDYIDCPVNIDEINSDFPDYVEKIPDGYNQYFVEEPEAIKSEDFNLVFYNQVAITFLKNLEEDLFEQMGIKSTIIENFDKIERFLTAPKIKNLKFNCQLIEELFKESNGRIGAIVETWEKTADLAVREGKGELHAKHLHLAMKILKKNGKYGDNAKDSIGTIVEDDWFVDFLDANHCLVKELYNKKQ